MNAVNIKIASVMTVIVTLNSKDAEDLDQALGAVTQGMPDYFENELAVADIGALQIEPESCNWAGLIALFRNHKLQLVAIRHAPALLHDEIVAAGLAIDHGVTASASTPPASAETARNEAASALPQPGGDIQDEVSVSRDEETVSAPPSQRTLFIDMPVRAGQRIYARNADLVITATVNNGAEIIADGSVHVYAPMRGRVLAGASGDTTARIYGASMQPELLSIAGIYQVFADGFPEQWINRPVQVRLTASSLDIAAVG